VSAAQQITVAGVVYLNRRQFFEAVASRYGYRVLTVAGWCYQYHRTLEDILERASRGPVRPKGAPGRSRPSIT
jgi:hypothetical protein